MAAQEGNAQDRLQDGVALPEGYRLGDYRIAEPLGHGGFSIVYKAWDDATRRHVAIKEYLPATQAVRVSTASVRPRTPGTARAFSEGLAAFIDEGRMLANCDQPNIVRVHRLMEANGTAYLVMDYYDATTLEQFAEQQPNAIDEKFVRHLFSRLLDALGYLHQRGLCHRDVSPNNILVRGAAHEPVLIDFGGARQMMGGLTKSVDLQAKEGYSPIELYSMERVGPLSRGVGAWSDIYSLGATAYFLVAGERPRMATSRMAHDTQEGAQRAAAGRFSPQLLRTIDQCLRLLPDDRPQSCDMVRTALDAPERRAIFGALGERVRRARLSLLIAAGAALFGWISAGLEGRGLSGLGSFNLSLSALEYLFVTLMALAVLALVLVPADDASRHASSGEWSPRTRSHLVHSAILFGAWLLLPPLTLPLVNDAVLLGAAMHSAALVILRQTRLA
jgi:hypothetical protein